MVLATISATAQKDGSRAHKKESKLSLTEYSPEEIAQLKTKQLTLALDLTAIQQQKIQSMEVEKFKARKAKIEAHKNKTLAEAYEKPKKEERLARMNERLDKKIAEKATMKELLDPAQYERWEQMEAKKHMKQKRRKGPNKKHKHR